MEPTTDLRTDRYGVPRYAGQRMEKADFLRWESDDNYAYNDGLLEPTTATQQDKNYLSTNLENYFIGTVVFRDGYRMRPEMDVWVNEKQMRRPDIAFFSADQMSLMAVGTSAYPVLLSNLGPKRITN